jgi:hypothetical protein
MCSKLLTERIPLLTGKVLGPRTFSSRGEHVDVLPEFSLRQFAQFAHFGLIRLMNHLPQEIFCGFI